jgi:protein disulfide-isomerase
MNCSFRIQGFPTIFFANGVDTEGKVNFEGLGYVAGGPEAWFYANGILKKIISISLKNPFSPIA